MPKPTQPPQPPQPTLLVTGFEPEKGRRIYAVDLEGGKPRPIGPEGAFFTDGAHGVSPDGKWIAAFGPDGKAQLFSAESGSNTTLPIPGAEDGQEAIRWCDDGRCVFVIGEAWKVYRLDVRTGRRDLWKAFSSGDSAQSHAFPTPDGRWYVVGRYEYRSELFLVDGVK